MRRFLLYVHTGRRAARDAMLAVLDDLAERQVEAVLMSDQVAEVRALPAAEIPEGLIAALEGEMVEVLDVIEAGDPVELGIVLGGDGTILRALESVRDADIPVHGVNLGHVGFLAESEAEGLAATVSRLLDGEYEIESRSALHITVLDADDAVIAEHWAMNEGSLEKANRQRMVYVAIEIDGRPVSSFGCDGVLLSTSTGSTAYAFSAGGPVIWPEVDALLLVPLAAHALFARPLVLGRSSVAAVEMTMDNRDDGVLTLDGRRTVEITAGMRVEARLSPDSVRLVRMSSTPFADRLVEKFQLPVVGWRGRSRGPRTR
ncbi:NAD kinase [Brachybacterium muris]|uniref:NAD kinase n=1 Tax=Brachybacterium muris TaxID=219301 RepID=UPI00195CF56F|nr:NAD kinase [Brachybacterium muris]MBM7500386.1 NAD+ kinase [Brachybacterium muris]MCT1430127.1 NAD kinase [Brachybacterium muris]MCT1997534.1 NAD kinase [Brachybacterium muris]MCT2178313.1 NAD kinase [Brachybacterium muris]